MGRQPITLEPPPEVQLFGESVAVLHGGAALDAYRLLSEGIRHVRQRDGIEPSPRLLRTVAALQVAAAAHVRSDIADVRDEPTSASSVVSENEVGVKEVARMLNVGER